MGNDLNCCRGENKDENQINDDFKERENGTNSNKNIEKVSMARANNRFLLDDDNLEIPQQKNVIQMKGQQKSETPNSYLEEPANFGGDANKEEESKDEKEINRDVEREVILRHFEKQNIIEREREFPKFTREYSISKGNLNQYEIESLFPEKESIFDNGTLIPNKSFYYGEKNKQLARHGFGCLILTDGSKFTGWWINNEFSYFGRYIDSELTVQEGFFKNGLIHGFGEEITATSKYTGNFENGKKQGNGILETETEIYEGNFINGNKHGQGKLQFLKTNNYYEGEFQNGKIEGSGHFKWANGDEYIGEFQNGILHGEGTYSWKNGDIYKGSYINGMRSGKGRLQNANGKIYEGDFANNLPHGKGIIIKDGKVSEVEFNNGTPLMKRKSTVKA